MDKFKKGDVCMTPEKTRVKLDTWYPWSLTNA